MVKSLTASLVSQEEEERHQRNLNEDEQLKNQIAEVSPGTSYGTIFNKTVLLFSCALPSKMFQVNKEDISQIRDILCFNFFTL